MFTPKAVTAVYYSLERHFSNDGMLIPTEAQLVPRSRLIIRHGYYSQLKDGDVCSGMYAVFMIGVHGGCKMS